VSAAWDGLNTCKTCEQVVLDTDDDSWVIENGKTPEWYCSVGCLAERDT
jgi:hypothetical protein